MYRSGCFKGMFFPEIALQGIGCVQFICRQGNISSMSKKPNGFNVKENWMLLEMS